MTTKKNTTKLSELDLKIIFAAAALAKCATLKVSDMPDIARKCCIMAEMMVNEFEEWKEE